jgi:putative transposase
MALSEDAFNRYCQALQLSEATRALVELIRHGPPARRVRSRAGNVCVRYPSQKMGCVVQAESHRVEFAGVLEYEFTASVLEYYDQPLAIQIRYATQAGRPVAPFHTPDFFVLRQDAAGWEEWKTEDELERLAVDKPNRYRRDGDGRWRCPPGEQAAAAQGLYYRVRSSAEIDWCWQRNVDFLADYLRAETPAPDPNIAAAILDYVGYAPGLTLAALLGAHCGGSDEVYALIATGRLYVDLHAAPLADPACVHLFRDPPTAQAHHRIQRELAAQVPATGEVEPAGPETESLPTDQRLTVMGSHLLSGDAHERLIRASAEALARAQARYARIEPVLAGTHMTANRTERDWLRKYRQAERRCGSGYLGGRGKGHQQGNRTPRLDKAVQQRLDEHIATHYETLQQPGKHVAYGHFLAECQQAGLPAPSHTTYYRRINQRQRYPQLRKREGVRAAYPHESFYWELSQTTPRHGDRPFHIGHLDHTQLDIELVHSKTGRNLGRPWATFLQDAFSRRLLALELSFDEPSYRSCMMVLRTAVARFERLPGALVVDGGREFASIYFEALLALYGRSLKTRPGGKPRFGSVIERLFGTTNQDFIHNLRGNTQIMRKVRQVTQAVNPKGQATWTLEMLFAALCEWGYEIYDRLDHAALGQSPRETFEQGLAQSGYRPGQRIANDEAFRLATLPTTPRGQAKVEPNRGVTVHGLYYWSEAFRSRLVEGQTVPVRYDPFDVGVAYAFLHHAPAADGGTAGGRWVRCLSEYYSRFKGRSEREIALATAELRRQHSQPASKFRVRAKALAGFLDSPTGQGVVAAQQARDAEARSLRDGLGRADPSSAEAAPAMPVPVEEAPAPSEDREPATSLEFYGDF